MSEKQTIMLGTVEVVIDPERLNFNEKTLSEFFETEAGHYDFFGARLADAEYLMQRLELQYDVLYSERFRENKENASSDKVAEAMTKSDHDVEQAKKEYLAAKHKVRLLQQHLRAWDRAHENAQSRGHFLRKEMDKLSPAIYGSKPDNYLERQIAEVVKEIDNNELDKLLGE